MRLGLVGTGLLGNAIGLNLLKRGHSLIVYNRTKSKTVQLEQNGAKIANTPKQVSENSDVVFTVVKNADAVNKVAFGDDCIACESGMGDGMIPLALDVARFRWLPHPLFSLPMGSIAAPSATVLQGLRGVL